MKGQWQLKEARTNAQDLLEEQLVKSSSLLWRSGSLSVWSGQSVLL